MGQAVKVSIAAKRTSNSSKPTEQLIDDEPSSSPDVTGKSGKSGNASADATDLGSSDSGPADTELSETESADSGPLGTGSADSEAAGTASAYSESESESESADSQSSGTGSSDSGSTTAQSSASGSAVSEQLSAWVVQAGSFVDEANALAVRDKLRSAGFPSFVTPTEAATPSYRVRVGPMIDLQRAESRRDEVMRLLEREAIVVSYP